MALMNFLAACLATWLPLHVLPDNARSLWLRADLTRRLATSRVANGGQRLAGGNDASRPMLRRDATQAISATERLVEEYGDYIDRHQASSDPKVRATVQEFRGYKKNLEGDLAWYRQLPAGDTASPRPR